jgi:hypothetical protein
MTLGVALVEDEVAVGDAVYTHMHDGIVAHAHCHAPVAPGFGSTRTCLLTPFLAVAGLAHTVVVVIVALAARALSQPFLRPVQLCLLVRLHCVLLLALHLLASSSRFAGRVPHINFGRGQANDCDFRLVGLVLCGLRQILLALTSLQLRVLSLTLFLFLWNLLVLALYRYGGGYLGFIALLWAASVLLLIRVNYGQLFAPLWVIWRIWLLAAIFLKAVEFEFLRKISTNGSP